jgi:hypothetical protein
MLDAGCWMLDAAKRYVIPPMESFADRNVSLFESASICVICGQNWVGGSGFAAPQLRRDKSSIQY